MDHNKETLPPSDDFQSGPESEQALLDAVLQNSDFTKDLFEDVPLPEEQEAVDDTVESSEIDDQEELEEIDTEEEATEEVGEELDEDADDEDATQESDVYTADDLDLDAKVTVTIDGEDLDVSFADLLKGYQTDASISKKGRELGEARKELEAEKETAMKEVQQLSEASAAVLMGQEQNLAKEYHDIEAAIEKARDEGDTYEVSELKDKREQLQKKYWDARKQREGLQETITKQKETEQQKVFQQQIEYFNEHIEEHVPGFDQDTALAIREFAIEEGIDANIVDTIADPVVVKVLNDYRKLKSGVTKGAARRKSIPAKKAIPAKKGKTISQKQADNAKMAKARAFKEDASPDDQMAFLREYAAKSLGNI